MPDRIVRAKILNSDAVNLLSWAAEVFYRRLMSVADDYGRCDARTSILRGSLYALKLDKVSDADVVKWLGECSNAGLVSVYQVEGKEYLEIKQFNQRLRAMKSQFPPPVDGAPLTSAVICCHLPPEEKRKETESESEKKEKGNEGPLPIEHCKFLAMKDDRWVRANKTHEKEVDEFNLLLTKRGHYEKVLLDYKSHFANWKEAGKKDSAVNQAPAHTVSAGGPPLTSL